MKYLLLTLLLISPITDINEIARTNELKKEAKKAFLAGDYQNAIQNYHFLLDSMGIEDPEIRMNLANAYYESGDTTEAVNNYNMLRDSEDTRLASRAYQQLGVIKNKQKKQEEALADFKDALRKNPYNEEARYNYELLKKLLDEQKKKEEQEQKQDQQQDQKEKKDKEQEQNKDQQQQDQQKGDKPKEDQQKQDQEQKEQQDQEGKESEQKDQQEQKNEEQKEGEEEKKNDGKPQDPSDEQEKKQPQNDDLNISPDKLKEMNLSEEKARMILEAMRNQEIQYLQQNKRKAEKRPSSGKPDW